MQCLKVLLLATAASLALTMADAQTNSTSEPLASRLAKRPLFPDTLNYVSALLRAMQTRSRSGTSFNRSTRERL